MAQPRDHDDRGVVMSTAGQDGARLVLAGALDVTAVERLRALLDDVAGPAAVVRIDLSRATHLPLGVLQALAAGHRHVVAGGGSLVLTDPSPAATRALRTSGLHRALQVERRPLAETGRPEQSGTAVC